MFTFWVVLWLEEVGMDVSHSLGTVSLDKPQILPYPCIKREDAKSWKLFISGRFLKQDLRKQISEIVHKINHK